jgi:hypothetical protein
MMTNQLCAGAGTGSLCLEKAALPLPVPLNALVLNRRLVCRHQFVHPEADSDSGVA